MTVVSRVSKTNNILEIKVGEIFDFSQHQSFRNAYQGVDLRRVPIVVDLTATRHMDSSALGMLLVLRERAGGESADICLVGMNEAISKVLEVSRFEELFRLR